MKVIFINGRDGEMEFEKEKVFIPRKKDQIKLKDSYWLVDGVYIDYEENICEVYILKQEINRL